MRRPNPRAEAFGEADRRGEPGTDPREGAHNQPLADDLLEPLTRSIALARRLVRVEWRRIGLASRIRARRAVLRAWELMLVATLTVVCAIVLVHGVVDGLSQLFGGSAWAGEVVGSLALLGVTAWAVMANQARRDRKHLRATGAKLGPCPRPEDFR